MGGAYVLLESCSYPGVLGFRDISRVFLHLLVGFDSLKWVIWKKGWVGCWVSGEEWWVFSFASFSDFMRLFSHKGGKKEKKARTFPALFAPFVPSSHHKGRYIER